MKYTTKVNGQDTEIEIPDEEIVKASKGNKGLLFDLLTQEGFEFGDKDTAKKIDLPKKEEIVSDTKTDPAVLKVLETLTGKMEKVDKWIEEQAKIAKSTAEKETEAKAKAKVDEAVKAGKITEGEKEEWVGNLKTNFDAFSKVIDRLPADPVIVKQNQQAANNQTGTQQNNNGSQNQQAGNNSAGKIGGQATFTREQIKQMSPQEYAKNRDAILEATKSEQII